MPDSCSGCALNARCNYVYSNLAHNGIDFVPQISPVQCAHEQLLTPIADSAAEKLYKKRNALFVHKHYNEFYPVISLEEDANHTKADKD